MQKEAFLSTPDLPPDRRAAAVKVLHLPVAFGDAADKVTILEIKLERIADPQKHENISRELALVSAALFGAIERTPEFDVLFARLKDVNERLWDIEDAIRECEARRHFGAEFVRLARGVYRHNDERARLKREINAVMGSAIVEEKSYAPYAPAQDSVAQEGTPP